MVSEFQVFQEIIRSESHHKVSFKKPKVPATTPHAPRHVYYGSQNP